FTIILANGQSCKVRYLVKVGLTAIRVNGSVWVGRTSIVSIIGTGFYNKPSIKSNEARTSAVIVHDYGRELVVRVTLPPGSAQGWHVFTIILANGQSCKVRYLVKVGLTAIRVNGSVWVGRTSIVSIIGTGFYNKPSIKSNEARTSAVVVHDYGRELVVRVTLPPGSAQGWHVFTIILANGQSCKVRYLVKVGLTAIRVNGSVWVGRTSIVSIIGTGFYNKPSIKSNEARTSAVVVHDYGRELVVRVTLPPGSAQGWHVFTII